jgi:ribonuclease-3
MDLSRIQQSLGYTFINPKLLKQALVHRSYLNEKDKDEDVKEHNERLEFLGDAVLELIVTDYLYKQVDQNEGMLTALRASLVNYKTIGEVGNAIDLDTTILLSRGEKEELGRARLTIVADCVEAILGALYLDGGLEVCKRFVEEKILVLLPEIIASGSYKDFKTLMQEFCQKHTKITPHYRVISSEGKDHEKVFLIGVWVGNEKIAEGEGRSKQEAETEAAQTALQILQKRFEVHVPISEPVETVELLEA